MTTKENGSAAVETLAEQQAAEHRRCPKHVLYAVMLGIVIGYYLGSLP